MFVRSNSEPAKIWVWNKFPLLLAMSSGLGLGAYGFFVKKFNFLWLVAGVFPATLYLLVASGKQPETTTQNAYRYILAKRAATCELEANTERL